MDGVHRVVPIESHADSFRALFALAVLKPYEIQNNIGQTWPKVTLEDAPLLPLRPTDVRAAPPFSWRLASVSVHHWLGGSEDELGLRGQAQTAAAWSPGPCRFWTQVSLPPSPACRETVQGVFAK